MEGDMSIQESSRRVEIPCGQAAIIYPVNGGDPIVVVAGPPERGPGELPDPPGVGGIVHLMGIGQRALPTDLDETRIQERFDEILVAEPRGNVEDALAEVRRLLDNFEGTNALLIYVSPSRASE
jgi:hypothetical protein